MTKQQKTVTIVLWVLAGVLMLTGGILAVVGVRPLLTFLGDLIANMTTGDLPEAPAFSEYVLAIVGLGLLLVGVLVLYVAGKLSKRYRRKAEDMATAARLYAGLDRMAADKAKAASPVKNAEHGFCVRCGREVEKADYRYCPYCGTALVQLSTLGATAATAPDMSPETAQSAAEPSAEPVESAPSSTGDEAAYAARRSTDDLQKSRTFAESAVTCRFCGSTYRKGEEVCLLCGRKLNNE